MENKERQILSEIMDMMSSIRSQLEVLDKKMAELQQVVGDEGADSSPIDLDIDDLLEDDLPGGDLPEADLPVVGGQEPAVIDTMTDRHAWRTDMPGTQVKDIRSAISLNDRILFINMLFGQDPMAFQDALTRINQMTSLDEAVAYVVAEHPGWDLQSDTVYRFMMAVRRKIR